MEIKCGNYIKFLLIVCFMVVEYQFVFINCTEKLGGDNDQESVNSNNYPVKEGEVEFISFNKIWNTLGDSKNKYDSLSSDEDTKRYRQKRVDSNQTSSIESSPESHSELEVSTKPEDKTYIESKEHDFKTDTDHETHTKGGDEVKTSTGSEKYRFSGVETSSGGGEDNGTDKSSNKESDSETSSEESKIPVGIDKFSRSREGIEQVDQVLHMLHKRAGKEVKRLNKERMERREEILKDQEFMMNRLESIISSLQKNPPVEKKTIEAVLKNQYISEIDEFPTMITNDYYKEVLEKQHKSFEKKGHEEDLLKLTTELQQIANMKKLFKPPLGKIDTTLFYEGKMGPKDEGFAIGSKFSSKGTQHDPLYTTELGDIGTSTKSTETEFLSDHDETKHSNQAESEKHEKRTHSSKDFEMEQEDDVKYEQGQHIPKKVDLKTSYRDNPKLALGSELVNLFESADVEGEKIEKKSSSFGRLTPVQVTTPKLEDLNFPGTHETRSMLKKGSPSIGRIGRSREFVSNSSLGSSKPMAVKPKATVGRLKSPSRATTNDKMRVRDSPESTEEYDIDAAKEFIISKKADARPSFHAPFEPKSEFPLKKAYTETKFVGDEGEQEESAKTSKRNQRMYRNFTRFRTPISHEVLEPPVVEVPKKKDEKIKRVIRRKT
ncbi:hypothetical protein FG379_000661 [Cryptosporidium bovis]|uniref:uncharacterized protein n=1 Tax=Cryptosporidium bovis TaxID=310047 RepID=UPI00351A87D7|nr:hypothetical protein FG379_000661 [Cryptosporidium bovis]